MTPRTDFIRVDQCAKFSSTADKLLVRHAVAWETLARMDDPHPSADRIPRLGGALPWREPTLDRRISEGKVIHVSHATNPKMALCGSNRGVVSNDLGATNCQWCVDRLAVDDTKRNSDFRPPPVCRKCGGSGSIRSDETGICYTCWDCYDRAVEAAKRKPDELPLGLPVNGLSWPPLWAGVLLLCLLPMLLGGCSQFVLYQHNDYRREDKQDAETVQGSPANDLPAALLRGWRMRRTEDRGRDAALADLDVGHLRGGHTFPGMFSLSPGISDLARIAGPGTATAHSAGARRAARVAADRGLTLLLVDPWPPNLEVPTGVPTVYVVTGRPGRVTVAPGTKLVELSHAGGACPWAWTVGHIYACRWPESVEAASMAHSGKVISSERPRNSSSMAAAAARMASAGSSRVKPVIPPL